MKKRLWNSWLGRVVRSWSGLAGLLLVMLYLAAALFATALAPLRAD
ncbi:MAG: hypothetical protein R3E79_18275 [Caldilineaceae bacterium]